MATIHEQIDELLAAEVHGQLPESERDTLHNHLVECATCRKLHEQNKMMNKILEQNFATQKADPTFEQRMLAGFRSKVAQRPSLTALLMNGLRLRVTQVAAVAALLLALVQVGRMITHEDVSKEYARDNERGFVTGSNIPMPEKVARFAAGRPGTADEKDQLTRADAGQSSNAAEPTPNTFSAAESGGRAPAAALEDRQSSIAGLQRAEKAKSPAPFAPSSEPTVATAEPQANLKLIRNAKVELEITSFDEAVQKITAFANEERGYVATSDSQKQANGKLRGEVVVKILPENLERFLQKVRRLGELRNQTIGTEDVTKRYFDTDARLKNARVMEQRLLDMLNTKTGKVSDLLQVEKELGRVREQIEKLQGDLKFWDSQVQFATVTISLAEKDLEEPAAFLLKERAQLALYAPEVEKIYNGIKALASAKVQITNAQLDRDNAGRVSARMSILIAPEESDAVIGKVKAMGRVENFQMQTERISQAGQGMSENAKMKRDKVELNISLSRDEQEQALQQTSLRIRTSSVNDKTRKLRELAEKQNGRVRSSSFNRDPNGREFADMMLRVPMKNYNALMQSLNSLGKVENVSVQREDRSDQDVDLANAPADLSIQVYSQGNIVSPESGLFATLRRTIGQSASAIMWSLRMIGVALAFLAPWAVALAAAIWIGRRIVRARGR
jgi:Domain of unknown function (DUF4349)